MRRAAFLLAAAFAQPCMAQEGFTGTWSVVKAEDAPWLAARPELKPYREVALRNARFAFSSKAVTAPSWMGCKKPKYEIMSLGFDELFEGGLSDPSHGLNNPKELAAKLGFVKAPVTSMLTGCSELLFHLVDHDTVVFGLNNVIYTLKRSDKAK